MKYQSGYPISGLAEAAALGATVFHAGTKAEDGKILTAGGRVLGVTAAAPTLKEALRDAYAAAGAVEFDGKYLRTDIGKRALAALEG